MSWIKIIEGDLSTLPKENEEILCYSEEGYMSVEKRRKGSTSIYCEQTDSGYATHWMLLPDEPSANGC